METLKGKLIVEGVGETEITLPIYPMDIDTAKFQKSNYAEYKKIDKAQNEALINAMKNLGFISIYQKCFNATRVEVKNNDVGGIISTWHSKHVTLDLTDLSKNSDLSFDIVL